jgi:phytoene dehydrogenase-like protein
MSTTQGSNDRRVVVIGGGVGGMAAALQMRAKGHIVVLVEKSEQLGGMAASFEENGVGGFYPLAFGDYSAYESLFALHGKKVDDYVDVIRTDDMRTRFIYDDKTSLDLGDLEFSLASLKKRSDDHATQYQRLYDCSRRQFEQMGVPTEVFAEVVKEHVEDEAVQMAINFRTALVGENPYSTSSFYIMMLHMQEMWGSFTAPGGVGGLVEALEQLMLDVGIEVVKGDGVASLECRNGEIEVAILQSGRKISCSYLISDISPHDLYGSLLPDEYGAQSRGLLGGIKYSPSIFSYHFTTRRCYSDLPPMMVIFPGDLEKFCSQVYDEGEMPDELLLGVYRASFYDSSFSPEGGDHFSVYLSVPNLQSDIRWEEVSGQLVEDIVARLEEYLLPNLSANILQGFHRTPLDMKSECSLPYGAGFGPQVTKADLGKEFFPGEDPDLSNLYLVGHYTMPGAGLNAVLMSAQFASAKIPAPA